MAARKDSFKTESYCVADAVSEAYGIAEELRDEMTEWRDNMEEKFSSTDKFSRVSEACDVLEGLDEPSEPACGAATEIRFDVQKDLRKSRALVTRPRRRDYAMMLLDGAFQAIESRIDAIDEATFAEEVTDEETEKLETEKDELETYQDEIERLKDELEGVEFPGMFG